MSTISNGINPLGTCISTTSPGDNRSSLWASEPILAIPLPASRDLASAIFKTGSGFLYKSLPVFAYGL